MNEGVAAVREATKKVGIVYHILLFCAEPFAFGISPPKTARLSTVFSNPAETN